MKKIILIHAHKELSLLNKLINELFYKNFIIYLHVDLKSKIDINLIDDRVNFINKRFDIVWGEFSQVSTTLYCIEQILKEQDNFSHIIFISGQDFPIKSNKEIDSFLDLNKDKSFISYSEISKKNENINLKWRYDHLHFPKNEVVSRKWNSLLYRLNLKKKFNREELKNTTYYYGSNWWVINRDLLEITIKKSTQKIKKYFKYVHCSDELYFQTLLLNSEFSSAIINNNLRYLEWENYNHPKILTEKDYNLIIESDAFFCRKVDYKVSEKLLELLSKNRNS